MHINLNRIIVPNFCDIGVQLVHSNRETGQVSLFYKIKDLGTSYVELLNLIIDELGIFYTDIEFCVFLAEEFLKNNKDTYVDCSSLTLHASLFSKTILDTAKWTSSPRKRFKMVK